MSKNKSTAPDKEATQESGPLTWLPEDKIEITGIEFHALNRALEVFETAIMAKNIILNRMVRDGIAKRVTPQAMTSQNDVTPEPIQENTEGVEPKTPKIDVVKKNYKEGTSEMKVAYKADKPEEATV